MSRLLPFAALSFVAASTLVPAFSSGHSRFLDPKPRNGADNLKDPLGPCGNVARTGNPTLYKAGQMVGVKWEETIDHPGCFLVDLSLSGDQNFMPIANIKHSKTGVPPRQYMAQVQLPQGVTCKGCTLRLRQIMLNSDGVTCPPSPLAANLTYYSCADIQIDTPPDMAGSTADLATAPGADLASAGNPPPSQVDMSTGCALGGAPAFGASGLFAGALFALALRRRHRRQSGSARA
jgi:hypothetical protein